MPGIDEQMAILMRGVDYGDPQIRDVMEKELRVRLVESEKTGKPLRVYLGVDPTAPDLHLGHTVPMRKLRQFQELGHEVVFLIGDFTSLIGDPSDKNKARPRLSSKEIKKNAKTYTDQAFKILDPEKTIIRYNSEWLSKLTFREIIEMAANFTVQQFLSRENFRKRYDRGDAIWLHELFYALMQGYDAVALHTDVQVGGMDQLFNLLAGRKLQEYFGQRPQVAITLPILVGTDGVLRMSKSTGNYIGIDEPAEEMYGKVMSIPDEAMLDYYNLVTRLTPAEIARIDADLKSGELHPRDAKMKLAFEIVSIFHGDEAARRAEEHFRQVFQRRNLPDEMPEYRLEEPVGILDLLREVEFVKSKGEARRLVRQGAVKVHGKPIKEITFVLEPPGDGRVVQVGKRRFLKLT